MACCKLAAEELFMSSFSPFCTAHIFLWQNTRKAHKADGGKQNSARCQRMTPSWIKTTWCRMLKEAATAMWHVPCVPHFLYKKGRSVQIHTL